MELDYVLVGGGLQNALIALALLHRRPDARIGLVERDPALGGNHVWSFHGSDVPTSAEPWLAPLVSARWDGWDVAFPGLSRGFERPYASIVSDRLHEVLVDAFAARPNARLFLGSTAATVCAHEVFLADGRVLRGGLVVDARGPTQPTGCTAYQKFVGLELALDRPSPLKRPLLMDATVEQTDGLRFVYALPFASDRVLVEDTYYSDDPSLERVARAKDVLLQARRLGLSVASVLRSEHGVLPLPLSASVVPSERSPLVAGFAGGFFHPTTGYSLPLAVRVAEHVATTPLDDVFGAKWRRLVTQHASQVRFAMLLNRLLFGATEKTMRRDVMERFHRLPEETIARFYAMRTTPGDRLRVLLGRPPRGVSLRSALAEVMVA